MKTLGQPVAEVCVAQLVVEAQLILLASTTLIFLFFFFFLFLLSTAPVFCFCCAGADREKDGPSCESSTADLSLRQARARRRTGTALMRLAEVQMMSGCFVEALSFLDKATDLLRPYGGIAYVEALCTIGNLYRALGSADKAKDDISFALILAYRADCVRFGTEEGYDNCNNRNFDFPCLLFCPKL
eukprot:Rmarinus@m.2443